MLEKTFNWFLAQILGFKMLRIILLSLVFLTSCVGEPDDIGPLPTEEQLRWHEMETYAFVHFGLNTFNDLEWGWGDTPTSTFRPSSLDCEQWVATFKQCGMKGVILTAKHHDGFCLWPTKSTDYNISNSPYKDGAGDLVKELSDACRKYGLKFGLYLSPWDRNNPRYGFPEYVDTYHQQIDELTSLYGPLFEFWFDGANGGNGYYGGANESRHIDAASYYDYSRARDTIINRHHDAMIFGGTCQTIRWVGNEQGWAGDTDWCIMPYADKIKNNDVLMYGCENGSVWMPAEVDVSIRPGWFYHQREDHQVKSLAKLVDIYYNSVGHNANLLLNFPIGLNGKVPATDSLRALEFHNTISNELSNNILPKAKVYADDERGWRFSASKTTDGDIDTYWATNDDYPYGTISFVFDEPVKMNRVLIQEYIKKGQRVKSFFLEGELNGEWFKINTLDTTSTIGYKRIVRFNTVELDKLTIYFEESKGPLCISNIEAYCAPVLLSEPAIVRDDNDMVTISTADDNALVFFTTDGSVPSAGTSSLYNGPFVLKGRALVKAVSYDPLSGNTSAVSTRYLPNSLHEFSVVSPKDGFSRAYDGSGFSSINLPMRNPVIEMEFDEPQNICGFSYLPSQERDASRHISEYKFFVDDSLVISGTFGNIRNNPVEQVVDFPSVKGNNVKFVATKNIDDASYCKVAEFYVITE